MSDIRDDYGEIALLVENLIAGFGPESLGASTPCSEWSIRDVMNHMIHAADALTGLVVGHEPGDPGLVGDDAVGDDAPAAWRESSQTVLERYSDPATLERMVDARVGQISGQQVLTIVTFDHFVHAWDLAVGSGQDFPETGVALASKMWDLVDNGAISISDDQRGRGRFAAPTHGSGSGSPLQRVLSYSGR